MKKFKKFAALSAVPVIAISAVAAANPHQAEAAGAAESLVVKAEQNKVILNRAISVDYQANAVKQPWTEYNKAKNDYNAAKAAVSKLNKKDRDRLNARLDGVKLWLDRTVIYIDAISSGKKLAGYQAALEGYMTSTNLAKMTEAYHKLSYEIKKQAAYLYKVYGQSTRQAILETYKMPAEELKNNAIYPVSIYMETNRLVDALKKGDEGEAEKLASKINDWFDYVDDENMIDALFTYYMDSVSPYVDFNEPISKFEVYKDASLPAGDPDAYAYDAFGFYNEAGDEIYSDAYSQGYIIKDEKGYFDEEGFLTKAYAETGIPVAGTDKIQIIKKDTNEVVAEAVVQIVK